MLLLNTIKTDCRQLLSWKFIVSFLITGVAYIATSTGFINEQPSVWYIVSKVVWGNTAFFAIYIMPAFAYSSHIESDWNSHVTSYWIIRVGVIRYTVSKIVVCAIAGFLTHFLGTLLLLAYLAPWMPLFVEDYSSTIYVTDWMHRGHITLGIVAYLADKAIGAAIIAALGMVISVYFMHPYVALSSPIVLIAIMSRVCDLFKLPALFNPSSWLHPFDTAQSAFMAISGKLIICILLLMIFCVVAIIGMRRRIRNT